MLYNWLLGPEGSKQGKALQSILLSLSPVISAAWDGSKRLKLELRRESRIM